MVYLLEGRHSGVAGFVAADLESIFAFAFLEKKHEGIRLFFFCACNVPKSEKKNTQTGGCRKRVRMRMMTYGRLSGRAFRLHTAARHTRGQSRQEEVEKLHDEEKWVDESIFWVVMSCIDLRWLKR